MPEDTDTPEVAAPHAMTPEVVEEEPDVAGEVITEPTKLIRIASMTRAMLEEVRQAPLDEEGRRRLSEIHQQSLTELREVLSPELAQEFEIGGERRHRQADVSDPGQYLDRELVVAEFGEHE